MDARTNLIKAMRRDNPAWVPTVLHGEIICRYDPVFLAHCAERGITDPVRFFEMDVRGVSLNPTHLKKDFSAYHQDLPADATIDEWGVAWISGSMAHSHFVRMHHPLAKASSIADIEAYPFPDRTAPYRYDGLKERINSIHAEGLATACFTGDIFERAWYMRGFEALLLDFLTQPDLADALLDRITEILVEVSAKVAGLGIDVLVLGDDLGGQMGLLMSPQTWRRFLKWRLARVITAAKAANPEVLIFYHSDGDISRLIPELIEIGVEILNPVQPECMDPAELKRLYGDRLSFWGTVGQQYTMPFGSPDDVYREVKERIETVGQGGGLVIAPTHILPPETPWENILAFFEAVKTYGCYAG